MRIATSPLGTNILERLDPFGEIVKSKILEYVQWASQKGMVLEATLLHKRLVLAL